MKRLLVALFAVLPLSGCGLLHLGAKPNDFECEGAYLEQYFVVHQQSELIRQIQRDVGDDQDPGKTGNGKAMLEAAYSPDASEKDPLFKAMFEGVGKDGAAAKPTRHILLLSGGGQWGAFGAGFLKGIRKNKAWNPPHFDVVTGVSTGAIQALFVAGGHWETLANEYTDPDKPLAIPRSILSIPLNGYSNDTAPLRRRLEEVLCKDDTCAGMVAIGEADTRVFIGMVESRTGDFKVVDITRLIREASDAEKGGQHGSLKRAARCVAGVTMASAAVPVQLRPVRLTGPGGSDPRTYVDGGVRLSVFESEVSRLAELDEKRTRSKFNIYVMRNGPTVVMPNLPPAGQRTAQVDLRPDAGQVGKMSYSTLVNQNEIMSIASLRLMHPNVSIFVATADGYATRQEWRTVEICRRTPKAKGAFDIKFMQCLARFGEEKARVMDQPWIRLSAVANKDPKTKAGAE